eukprot:TRINITY_DN11402_c0_g1_i1.p1 TRINITY_DN11402_c0_g1~~TRINITY_DN11402_c0_g1_i1.p1  ORF type:complete len:417 (+),score=89.98 TRINITY_DN11402_c0_g1_i1:43-1251(+)
MAWFAPGKGFWPGKGPWKGEPEPPLQAPTQAPAQSEWDPEELIAPAVHEALGHIAHLENEWDIGKMEKRIRGYAKNASKGLAFGKNSWQELVNEYADAMFASIFQALGDRQWLNEADLLPVVDAGIKETFPEAELADVPQDEFERTVLQAHDRAFEEQRFASGSWDTIRHRVHEKKLQQKTYKALEEGRKIAAVNAQPQVADFVNHWVHASVDSLRQICGPSFMQVLPEDTLTSLLHSLVEAGALPLALTAKASEAGELPLEDWWIGTVVSDAYAGREMRPSSEATQHGGRGRWSGGGGWKGGSWNNDWNGSWKGNSANDWGAQKRWAGGAAANEPSAKRTRPSVAKGHPKCTQEEDCVGNPASQLLQHVDGEVHGDLYCADCWNVFASADASLKAEPYYGA